MKNGFGLVSSERAAAMLVPPIHERSFRRWTDKLGLKGVVLGKKKMFWRLSDVEKIQAAGVVVVVKVAE